LKNLESKVNIIIFHIDEKSSNLRVNPKQSGKKRTFVAIQGEITFNLKAINVRLLKDLHFRDKLESELTWQLRFQFVPQPRPCICLLLPISKPIQNQLIIFVLDLLPIINQLFQNLVQLI